MQDLDIEQDVGALDCAPKKAMAPNYMKLWLTPFCFGLKIFGNSIVGRAFGCWTSLIYPLVLWRTVLSVGNYAGLFPLINKLWPFFEKFR